MKLQMKLNATRLRLKQNRLEHAEDLVYEKEYRLGEMKMANL